MGTRRVWALQGPKASRVDASPAVRLHVENSLVAESGAVTVYLYAEIGYWGVTAADFAAVLSGIGPTADLTVRINSPGGDVYDALAIYNLLRAHGGTVTTIVDGIAASAASYIMQAGAVRKIARNADVMIHDAWGFCGGNAADMRRWADELDRMSDNIADIYAQASGRDVAEIRAAMVAETWYSGREAVAAGLADELTDGTGPDEDDGDTGGGMDDRAPALPLNAKPKPEPADDEPEEPKRPPVPTVPLVTDVADVDLFAGWPGFDEAVPVPENTWSALLSRLTSSTTDTERAAS